MTEQHRLIDENCAKLRAYVLKYVLDRKNGVKKCEFKGQVDLLSLFFEKKEIFTDDFIVDELIDFFTAASVTTQAATQTIVSHFIKDPKSLARLRAEFDKVKEGTNGNLEDVLAELVNLDTI